MSGLILSLDIGTSSTRAMLFRTEDGAAVPNSLFDDQHEPTATPDGGMTLDPENLVEEAVTCAERSLKTADGPVRAVAVSTFWHSFLGVTADGTPATPVLLWSDRRSAEQVAKLRESLDADAYLQRTGCQLHVSYPPGRLLWLKETNPEAFQKSVRFLSPGEYLVSRLFGMHAVVCSTSMASASGLYHQGAKQWDADVLSAIGVGVDRLSPVAETPAQGLRREYRERLRALADVPWFPALGDGACSNIGCGAVTPEKVALMIGTSGALRVTIPGPTPPDVPHGLWRYQWGPERFLLGGALSNGGLVWDVLRKLVRTEGDDDELEARIDALPPDGHGLTVLPFLAGERAPLWRDDLRATIHGVSTATTPEDLTRAHLEAVALRFRRLRNALRPVAPSAEIIGTGAGLIASPTWARIIADALGEPLLISSEKQASSRGAALVARERLGNGKVEDAPLPTLNQTITPDPENTEIYQKALARQERLLDKLLIFED